MGKVYKTVAPISVPELSSPVVNLYKSLAVTQSNVLSNRARMTTTPEESQHRSVDILIEQAESDIETGNLDRARENLLNLVAHWNDHLRIHELLTDLYLKSGALDLARKHCQICARIIQNEIPTEIFSIKNFRVLLAEAGEFSVTKQKFEAMKASPITHDNYHSGTKVALDLAVHYIAQGHHSEAEALLTEYRDQYLEYLANVEA